MSNYYERDDHYARYAGVLKNPEMQARYRQDKQRVIAAVIEALKTWPNQKNATRTLEWMKAHPGMAPKWIVDALGGWKNVLVSASGCFVCGSKPVLYQHGKKGFCRAHKSDATAWHDVVISRKEREQDLRNERYVSHTIAHDKRERERKRRERAR